MKRPVDPGLVRLLEQARRPAVRLALATYWLEEGLLTLEEWRAVTKINVSPHR